MTKTIYFPACGFGFWYLLGKYSHIHNETSNHILIGSSAGSLICFCSLIDRKYPLYETIEKCAMEVLDTYNKPTTFSTYIQLLGCSFINCVCILTKLW